MTLDDVLRDLRDMGDVLNVAGMAFYGIVGKDVLGISMPRLKEYARDVKKTVADRHELAEQLWRSNVYEARVIAYLIDEPNRVTAEQMEKWSGSFDNWAMVDGTCSYLFCRTPLGYEKAFEWCEAEEEFRKRAAFSLMAYLAVHDKKADDDRIAAFLPLIEKHAYDDRPMVKKAVNWALRQIGKRSEALHGPAVAAANRIHAKGTRSAKWIAADALRELKSEAVMNRLKEKEARKKR